MLVIDRTHYVGSGLRPPTRTDVHHSGFVILVTMADPFEPLQQVVSATDADFSVRIASFDDLVRLQREAQDSKLTGRWSSEDAVLQQVQSDASHLVSSEVGATDTGAFTFRRHRNFAGCSSRDDEARPATAAGSHTVGRH